MSDERFVTKAGKKFLKVRKRFELKPDGSVFDHEIGSRLESIDVLTKAVHDMNVRNAYYGEENRCQGCGGEGWDHAADCEACEGTGVALYEYED